MISSISGLRILSIFNRFFGVSGNKSKPENKASDTVPFDILSDSEAISNIQSAKISASSPRFAGINS